MNHIKYPKLKNHYPATEIIGGIFLMADILLIMFGWELWKAVFCG